MHGCLDNPNCGVVLLVNFDTVAEGRATHLAIVAHDGLQLALRFYLIFLCQCWLDRGAEVTPDRLFFRVTMVPNEKMIPDRAVVMLIHQT